MIVPTGRFAIGAASVAASATSAAAAGSGGDVAGDELVAGGGAVAQHVAVGRVDGQVDDGEQPAEGQALDDRPGHPGRVGLPSRRTAGGCAR